jgi:hypothetical protein
MLWDDEKARNQVRCKFISMHFKGLIKLSSVSFEAHADH